MIDLKTWQRRELTARKDAEKACIRSVISSVFLFASFISLIFHGSTGLHCALVPDLFFLVFFCFAFFWHLESHAHQRELETLARSTCEQIADFNYSSGALLRIAPCRRCKIGVLEIGRARWGAGWSVVCVSPGCSARTGDEHETKTEAIEAWGVMNR